MKPISRAEEIITEQIADETLVYDLKRKRAHCLNSTASAVWKCCDGATAVGEIVGRLRRDFGLEAEETLVRSALGQLQAAGLIQAAFLEPAPRKPSRREFGRRVSIGAALMLPVVTSIVVPTPAAAQSAARCGNCGGSNNGRRRRRRRGGR